MGAQRIAVCAPVRDDRRRGPSRPNNVAGCALRTASDVAYLFAAIYLVALRRNAAQPSSPKPIRAIDDGSGTTLAVTLY